MAESKKEDTSASKPQKKSSILDTDDFGKEFLSSWKTMSVSEDDGLDFKQEAVTKGKKSAFNFDKLDMDFSLDGDFSKKMSSFNVDMSDLDFSSPPKKLSKPKERSTEESINGKQGEKKSRFSFSFDFNELDSFDFGSDLMKGEKKSDKASDNKGFNSPGKEDSVQALRSKPVASIDAPEDSDTHKLPTSQNASSSESEQLIGGVGKFNSTNGSPSTSANFGNVSPSHSTEASLEKEIIVSEKETNQCSQQSQKTVSTESNAEDTIQESSIELISKAGFDQEANPELEGEVCSSATAENTNPVEALNISVKLCNQESSPTARMSGPKSTKNDCDKMLVDQSGVEDTPGDQSMQGSKDIKHSTGGNFAQKMLHSTRTANESNAKAKHLLAPSLRKVHQPTKEKESGIIQSKYFNRPVDTVSQQNAASNSKNTSSIGNKKIESLLLSSADPRRQEGNANDAQAGNPKVDTSKSHDPAVAKGSSVILGNGNNDNDHEISSGYKCLNMPLAIVLDTITAVIEEHVIALLITLNIPFAVVDNITKYHYYGYCTFDQIRHLSCIASIRSSKSILDEGNKLSLLHVAKKTLESSSLKLPKLVPPIDQSHSKVQTEIKSMTCSGRNSEIPCATANMDRTVTVEIQRISSPSMKRKMVEESKEDPVTSFPSKRITSSPTECRDTRGSLDRVATKRVRSSENLLDGYNSSPTFDVHRDECLKELEVPLLIENDGNVEKAEAYTKELEDICNMLKKKHEEAKELLVRAIVSNNNLLMLNHPIYEEKISFYIFTFRIYVVKQIIFCKVCCPYQILFCAVLEPGRGSFTRENCCGEALNLKWFRITQTLLKVEILNLDDLDGIDDNDDGGDEARVEEENRDAVTDLNTNAQD
ncbi:hypothetical protein IFM89_019517 [Coptis chinensis]|uniref:Uncharacterized protein n=1 Tax=Coptis chinensis TaxID=261450 RepID=A0A835I286_9MAGN|nr:hypothetical protein IFM89_019517 [Coptis chinensis]